MSKLSYGEKAPEIVNVVIEIRKGDQNKYEMDKETGMIMLDRVTPLAMGYPADYGYVPDTLCEDGDPLDALLVIDESVPQGVVVPCRPIGVLRMVDTGEADEKLICVAVEDVTMAHVESLENLGIHFKEVVEHYYRHYKDWKNNWKGVEVSFDGWGDADDAKKVIQDSIARAKA